jgi:hypothetical protein
MVSWERAASRFFLWRRGEFEICDALTDYGLQIFQIRRFGLGLRLQFAERIPEQIEKRTVLLDAPGHSGSRLSDSGLELSQILQGIIDDGKVVKEKSNLVRTVNAMMIQHNPNSQNNRRW